MNLRRKEPVPVVHLEQLITSVRRETGAGHGEAAVGTDAGTGSDSIQNRAQTHL